MRKKTILIMVLVMASILSGKEAYGFFSDIEFVPQSGTTSTPFHNDAAGIQGGISSERYHLSEAYYNQVLSNSTNSSSYATFWEGAWSSITSGWNLAVNWIGKLGVGNLSAGNEGQIIKTVGGVATWADNTAGGGNVTNVTITGTTTKTVTVGNSDGTAPSGQFTDMTGTGSSKWNQGTDEIHPDPTISNNTNVSAGKLIARNITDATGNVKMTFYDNGDIGVWLG